MQGVRGDAADAPVPAHQREPGAHVRAAGHAGLHDGAPGEVGLQEAGRHHLLGRGLPEAAALPSNKQSFPGNSLCRECCHGPPGAMRPHRIGIVHPQITE